MTEMDEDDDEVRLVLSAREREEVRKSDLDTHVLPRVKSFFVKHRELRSALFVVSQHYSDNAMDEVHGHIVFSNDVVPRWPHICDWRGPRTQPDLHALGEVCTHCNHGHGDTYFSLPYGESSFRAWEAYCSEYGNQEQDLREAYLPCALIRRGDSDEELDVEYVAEPVRGWPDAPDEKEVPAPVASVDADCDRLLDLVYANPDDLAARHVLSDALLERREPRGEYLAIALSPSSSDPKAKARADELFAEHSREWLGPLSLIASRDRARFANGFVEHVAAYFPDLPDDVNERDAVAPLWTAVEGAREWHTVRSLKFLPRSRQPLRSVMRHVRRLGPLRDDAVLELGASGHAWAIEHLHITPVEPSIFELLAEPAMAERLPHLKTLVVSGNRTTADDLAVLRTTPSPLWKKLRALHISAALPYAVDLYPPSRLPINLQTTLDWIEAIFSHGEGPLEIGFGPVAESGEPAGPWLYLQRASQQQEQEQEQQGRLVGRITMPSLGAVYPLSDLGDAIAALPSMVRGRITDLVLEPSSAFQPKILDVQRLQALGISLRIAQ